MNKELLSDLPSGGGGGALPGGAGGLLGLWQAMSDQGKPDSTDVNRLRNMSPEQFELEPPSNAKSLVEAEREEAAERVRIHPGLGALINKIKDSNQAARDRRAARKKNEERWKAMSDLINKPEQLPNNVINRSKTMNWDKEIAWPDRAPSPTPTEPGQLIDMNAWKYIK